jgi:hypothetical protein
MNFKRETKNEVVLKLASLPKSIIEDVLLRRGLDPDSIEDVKAALALVGTPITPQDVVAYSFTKHGTPPAFGKGRFGDGTAPVFYAALERQTCEEEVSYHLREEIAAVPLPRFYQFIACDFSGAILNLFGEEQNHPELVSQTESGYPFCRALAQTARGSNIDGFHAPSARRVGGICTPIFSSPTIANPKFVDPPRIIIGSMHGQHHSKHRTFIGQPALAELWFRATKSVTLDPRRNVSDRRASTMPVQPHE